jgi:hypothetical protein
VYSHDLLERRLCAGEKTARLRQPRLDVFGRTTSLQ